MFTPIPIELFRERTDIGAEDLEMPLAEVKAVVSLRSMRHVSAMLAMKREYLAKLLSHIPIAGDPKVKVYADCKITDYRFDPNQLRLGQTFVERAKYTAILENLSSVFSNFITPRGISKMPPYILFGYDEEGRAVLSHYLPPIVELNGGAPNLLDGVHRNFIVRGVGTTVMSIVVKDVKVPFPCQPMKWRDVKVVSVKPPLEERYFGLKPDYFRDLKAIGIDG